MATEQKKVSEADFSKVPSAKGMRFAIAVAEWNLEITDQLLNSAVATLNKAGANIKDIVNFFVPGCFELPLAAQLMLKTGEVDAVLCIGCLIRGETSHFDYISQAVAQGIKDVGLKYNKPAVFGVLTVETMQQALDRCGGKLGNKGEEAAITAIKMVYLQRELQ